MSVSSFLASRILAQRQVSSFKHSLSYLGNLANNFTLSWDLGVIAFLFFAVFFYGFSVGPRKIGSLLVSIYFSYVLMSLFPYFDDLALEMSDQNGLIMRLAMFVITIFFIFFLISGSVLRSSLPLLQKEDGKWLHLVVLGVPLSGFLTSSFLGFLPELYYDKLSSITKGFFIENNANFWWALAGAFAFIILRKTSKK